MRRGPALALVSVVIVLTVTCIRSSQATDLHDVLSGYSITSWTQKDGLPPGNIWAIAQDADGFLWLGAEFGLIRFDGVKFTRPAVLGLAGLPPLPVRSLLAARDGSLWIGFGGTGFVSEIRHGQVINYRSPEPSRAAAVTALVENPDGNVFALWDGNLLRRTDTQWVDAGLSSEQFVRSAYVTSAGDLLVGTDLECGQSPCSAVLRRRPREDGFETFVRAAGQVQFLIQDARGHIWTTDSLVGFKRLNGPETRTSRGGSGLALLADRRGNIWVATRGQGVWRMRTGGPEGGDGREQIEIATDQMGLSNNTDCSLFEDREGNIWVGTSNGLNRLTPHKFAQMSDLGLVTGVETIGDGNLWAGTTTGVVQIPLDTLRPANRFLAGLPTRALHGDARGRLWIATDMGVERIENRSGHVVLSPVTRSLRKVSDITDAEDGVWLYDRERGLVHWTDTGLQPASTATGLLHSSTVGAILTDRRGRLWVGLNGQVWVLDRGAIATRYGVSQGLDVGTIRTMYEDRRGDVWIIGNRTLGRFHDGRFIPLPTADRFLGTLTTVVEDNDGNLWFGSAWGIVRINATSPDGEINDQWDPSHYMLYDGSDGVGGTTRWAGQRSAVRTSDGRLWFLTVRGITIVDRRALRTSHVRAPVTLEEIVVDHRPLDPSARTTLPVGSRRLEINYSMPDLTSTVNATFRYRLDGLDSDWVNAGTQRQAVYTNLTPGSYVFRVQANQGGGPWQTADAVWAFSIAPAFYQRPWFYSLLFVAVLCAIWAVWYVRIAQVRRQFALLLGERVRLSREIHDTLLQSLVGVSLQLDQLGADVETSPSGRQQFVRMHNQINEYIREARQSIWNLRSSMLARHDLATALSQSGERATEQGIGFDLITVGTPYRCEAEVEEQLLRIGQEAVTNAIRHSSARMIGVKLGYSDTTVTLSVADDGCGLDAAGIERNGNRPEEEVSHWGLLSMKERAEAVRGTFRVSTAAGQGTTIEVVVPARQRP